MSRTPELRILEWAVTYSEPNDPFDTGALVSRDQAVATLDAVLDDHAGLTGVANELRELCAAASQGAAVDWSRPMDEFRARLVAHFAAEEADDFFGSLVSQPRLLSRVKRLQAEHAELAFAAECLLTLARAKARKSDLAARVVRFLDRFEVHERAENALL
jgi:hypothetical protein